MSIAGIAAVFLLLAKLQLSAQNQVPSVSASDKEAALGLRVAAELGQRTTPIENPLLQNYVDRLGQRVAGQIPNAEFPFTFSLIAEDLCRSIHEPTALPGGYVFVPAALLLAAQDDAELTGVLAHAMGHIAQQHRNRRTTEGMIMNVAPAPPMFMASCGGGPGQPIPLSDMALQARIELEADLLAVQAMAVAGVDPNGLLRYISRIQPDDAKRDKTSRQVPPALPRAKRIAALEQAIHQLPARTYTPSVDLTPIQAELKRALPPRSSPEDAAPTLRRDGQ